jgi:hypothetical protein
MLTLCSMRRWGCRVDRHSSNITASKTWPRPKCADNGEKNRFQLKVDGRQPPLSRSIRPPGGGVMGGVIVAVGGIGNILILSSASAPSRVPQVVCCTTLVPKDWKLECGASSKTHLCNRDAAVQLDQIMEIAKKHRHWDKANVAGVPQQVWD